MTRTILCAVAVLAVLTATVVNAGVPNAAQKAAGNVTSFDEQSTSFRPVYRAPMVTTAPATTTERSFSYEPAPGEGSGPGKESLRRRS